MRKSSKKTKSLYPEIIDLHSPLQSVEELHAKGRALRDAVPRELHGQWKPPSNRIDVLKIIQQSNAGRQANLIPLRMARMAESPFAFFRGAAAIMANDLSETASVGFKVVLAGDAHISNFGIYGTAQRDLVFDLNDFDETVIGPWEWDLKRLAASVNVAGRENGMNLRERHASVVQTIRGYQENMTRLESMGTLDIWYLHAYPGQENILRKVPAKAAAVSQKVMQKALHSDNRALLTKVADKGPGGKWQFKEDPPILTRISKATQAKLVRALEQYSLSLSRERRYMLSRYRVADIAHRVVGVGSVGTRAYLALLIGKNDDDPLFLQIKEALPAAHAAYLPKVSREFDHQGKRVVIGQRALQASSDVMLGWTDVDGRPFYVRQMKNLKASIPIEWMSGEGFDFYGWACGALLARAHARTSEAAVIAGYCGKSRILRDSLALWAEAYGDQNDLDHARLASAIAEGRIVAAA